MATGFFSGETYNLIAYRALANIVMGFLSLKKEAHNMLIFVVYKVRDLQAVSMKENMVVESAPDSQLPVAQPRLPLVVFFHQWILLQI